MASSAYATGLWYRRRYHYPASSSSVYGGPVHAVNVNGFIYGIYWHTSPIDAHQLILAYGIYIIISDLV